MGGRGKANMVSLKKEKMMGFIFTLIAAILYTFIFVVVILAKIEDDSAISIETMTLMILQGLSFVILLFGIAFHKENLILGTLAASLVASVVSYVVNQVSSLVATPLDFSQMDWFYATDESRDVDRRWLLVHRGDPLSHLSLIRPS
jgi:hypothetical protein